MQKLCSLPFVFADKATVPGYLGIDVQEEVCAHLLDLKPDKILIVSDAGAQAHHPDYFAPLAIRCKRAQDKRPGPGADLSCACCGRDDDGLALRRTSAAPGEMEDDAAEGPSVEELTLPEGDECKSWDHLTMLMRWAFDVGATKRSVIVAFGGGALINVVGLFSSILYRGSKVVYVPTTFLAMHDVVTSMKTSICYDGRKNNIGSFYAPVKILIDTGFCRSLPRKELFSGLGELAKNALLFGGEYADGFIAALSKEQVDSAHGGSGDEFMMDDETLKNLIDLGIRAKMSMLLTDAYERTTGMVFEYGHTVSHAIEKAYGDGIIPHGLGVTYGMLSSSYAAERLGIMSPEDRKKHDELCWLLLKRWPLPEPKPTIERVMGFAMRDSKRGITAEADDEISDVVLRKIGDVVPTKTNNLSKFPRKLVDKWLYSMGFPHEGCAQAMSEVLTGEECKDLLDIVRTSSDSDLIGMGFEPLTVGFANHVWATKRRGQHIVIKAYTELAFLRLDAEAIGSVDVHSGENDVGPRVLYSSPQGLVIARVNGRTLEETHIHDDNFSLLGDVATAVAKLHELPVPDVCKGAPMLFRTIDKMLEAAARKPELWPQEMPGIAEVLEEVEKARVALESRTPSVGLCHGDLKPSNVILDEATGEVYIIDHELGGPNYRAFDLMKIFRTALKHSDSSMEHFFRVYSENIDGSTSEVKVNKLLQEARMFEPLTWLEAACFFLALPQFKPQETSKWHALAMERWEKYQATRSVLH
jgi:3-dehydroquinate synthase/2-deoxy-scyllo-inosose synthase